MSFTALHNEKELVKLIGESNQEAFASLVDHYWSRIYSVALTFIKSPEAAEEIVQDTFIKVWEKRESLHAIEKLDNWIFIVARNIIISQLRKKAPVISSLAAELHTDDEAILPEEMLRLKQLQHLILKGVDQLPEQQKRIYIMSREEGLSHDEICKQTGLARSTVKNALVKALNFLRQWLRQHGDAYMLLVAAILMWI